MDNNLADAHDDWVEARHQTLVQGVICAFKDCSVDLIPFSEVQERLHLIQRRDRGLQDIELDHIRGSVGRYRDFTSAFLPRQSHLRQRWEKVSAYSADRGIPPIEVYKVGQAYFVLDGNHRVSIARQAGMDTIPAYVSEYATGVRLSEDADLEEVILKSEQFDFMKKTNLQQLRPESEIRFTILGRYQELDCLISAFQTSLVDLEGRQVSDKEALLTWYDQVYLPVIKEIRASQALERFPGRTEADLFLWMWKFKEQLQACYPDLDDKLDKRPTIFRLVRQLWLNFKRLV